MKNLMNSLKKLCSIALCGTVFAVAGGTANAEGIPGFPYLLSVPDTVGGSGAPNASWSIAGAPKDGLSHITIKIVPTLIAQPSKNSIYWAYNSWFVNGKAWYMGIQPNPKNGFTALFSVFGEGSRPVDGSPYCNAGADGGPGTNCHLPYAFEVGKSYTLQVLQTSETATETMWRGSIRNDQSGAWSDIGNIAVTKDHGLLRTSGVTFTEFFARTMPCEQRPLSEAMFYSLNGRRNNIDYSGNLTKLNANGGAGGCNPEFYSDHNSYVYLRQGVNP